MKNLFENHKVYEICKTERVHVVKFYKTRDGREDWDCSMTLSIIDGTLMITGDLGDAVYEFYQPISFPAFENISVSRMNKKCAASEVGISFYEYSPEEAEAYFREAAEEMMEEAGFTSIEEWFDENDLDWDECRGSLGSEEEMTAWMMNTDYDSVIGEIEGTIGRVPHPRLIIHQQAVILVAKHFKEQP